MHLEEPKPQEIVQHDNVAKRQVQLFIQSSFYMLEGDWNWDLCARTVFCSDVMLPLQEAFEGTRGIVHPDDVPIILAFLDRTNRSDDLAFRIITTYGEVKLLMGQGLVVQEEPPYNWQQQLVDAALEQKVHRELQGHFQLLRDITDKASAFGGMGHWYYHSTTHQTWYADFVYRLHGIPAQGVNAYLHTFRPFIHPEDEVLVTEFMDRAFAERAPLHLDYRIVVDEVEKWVSYKSYWFYSDSGEAIFGGIYQDITEQKQIEKETEDYKTLVQFQRQQLLYDEQQVQLGHWQMNLLTRKTTYSDQYYRIFGLKPHEMTPTFGSFLNFVHPDDRGRVEAVNKQMLYEHALPEIEYRILRPDGRTRYILQRAKLVTVADELVIAGVIQDVTKLRQLELKVASLNDTLHLQSLLVQQSHEQANLVTWIVNLDEGHIQWSESFYKLTNALRGQPTNVSEKSLFALVHPQDAKAFRQQWEFAVQQQQSSSFECRLLVRGALQFVNALFRVHQHDGKAYFIGSLQNITTEQLLQQQLSQRVQLAESLSDNTLDRVIITNADNTVLFWNKACEKALGFKKAEAIGQNYFDLFPKLKTEETFLLLKRVHAGEKVVMEKRQGLFSNGYDTMYLMPLYQDNDVTGILHILHDVTEEVVLYQRLSNRLQLIEGLVQSSVDRIIALDRHMNYLYWNQRAEEYYSIPKEQVLGKNILEVFPALVNDPSYEEIRRALRGETVHIPANPEVDVLFETYLIPIKDENGNVTSLLWTAHDFSTEWQLQKGQRQAQEQLQVEHRRLKVAQTIGRLGSFEWQVGSNITYWSDELYRLMAMEPQSEVITLDQVDAIIHPDDAQSLNVVKEQSFVQPGYYKHQHRILRRDGVTRWVNHEWESMAGLSGTVVKVSGIVQDITEQVEAESQVRKSENLLRTAEQVAHTGSYEVDLATNTFVFSEGMYRLFGEEPYSFTPSLEWIDARSHPDDVAPIRAVLEEATIDAKPYHYFRRIYRKDGQLRTVEAHGNVVRGAEGHAVRFIGVVQDVTERKAAEKQLLESNAFIEEITQTTPDLITIHEAGTLQLVYINHHDNRKELFDFNALSPSIKNEERRISFEPNDLEKLRTFLLESAALANHDVNDLELKIGGERWICVRCKVFKRNEQGTALQLISFTTDITQQKEAEIELKTNLTILQHAEELAQMGNWEYEIGTHTLRWSAGMYRIFGVRQGMQLHPEIYLDHVVDEDRHIAKRIIKYLRKTHESFDETICIQCDNSIRLIKVQGFLVQDDAGHPWKLVGVDLDMTSIREAEKQLQESQRMLQQTSEASPDAIVIFHLKTRQSTYLNQRLAEWLEMSNDALLQMGMEGRLMLIHPDDRLKLLHFNEKLVAAKGHEVLTLDYRVRTNSGKVVWVRNRGRVLRRNKEGVVTDLLSILQDVTDEKMAELKLQQLNQSLHQKNKDLESKNEEITSFAFVGSHDLKEPLRKLHILSDWLLLKESAHLSPKGVEYLQRIAEMVKRLEALLNDLLILTQMNAADDVHAFVSLDKVAEKALQELAKEVEQSGAVIKKDNLGSLQGQENQLLHLFKNLISNAIKFQRKGNIPELTLHADILPGHAIADQQADPEITYQRICFTDNGIGVSQQYEKKIFAVFRRLHSKEEYPGMGMGLAICKKVMEKHGGFITVESHSGKGSTFCCYFPYMAG